MKFQNAFLVNFQRSYFIFKTGFENQVTCMQIYKKSILKLQNREVPKIPITGFENFKMYF